MPRADPRAEAATQRWASTHRSYSVSIEARVISLYAIIQHGTMCHSYRRSTDRTHDRAEETDDEELAEPDDPGFTEMDEAEDVRIVTDGGDE